MPNQTHDQHGREYAKLSELRSGCRIAIDGEFTCVSAGEYPVYSEDGKLYFPCRRGKHFLEGQADDGEHCVGVYGPLKE